MNVVSIKHNNKFLDEYIELCTLEWGTLKTNEEMPKYIDNKKKRNPSCNQSKK